MLKSELNINIYVWRETLWICDGVFHRDEWKKNVQMNEMMDKIEIY